jgi:hypothetical protein
MAYGLCAPLLAVEPQRLKPYGLTDLFDLCPVPLTYAPIPKAHGIGHLGYWQNGVHQPSILHSLNDLCPSAARVSPTYLAYVATWQHVATRQQRYAITYVVAPQPQARGCRAQATGCCLSATGRGVGPEGYPVTVTGGAVSKIFLAPSHKPFPYGLAFLALWV